MEGSRIPKYLIVCRPAHGKRSIGGQKRRWNDVLRDDLKKCDLLTDWREVAGERKAWRRVVKLASEDLNHHLEASEKEKKDQQKSRKGKVVQSGSSSFVCDELRCSFVSLTSAGLTNHRHAGTEHAAAQAHKQCIIL